ncbi:hypothetical protein HELRODRAFT_182832 [Helobdella robusta]|uniref:Major facilitator superfamily associated domain-containing protein n=1 Tax=Helobdella robusta TaxID=6412 RepID=T1FIT9_HELRO|nr:hypothetical protein HELRODRAFT_182832 [Helobdella robusta]ESN90135.1 hypothetical protein HELRODRAFT_182832 [Helobdella robusta]
MRVWVSPLHIWILLDLFCYICAPLIFFLRLTGSIQKMFQLKNCNRRYLYEIYTWPSILVLFAGFTLQMVPAAAFAFKPLKSTSAQNSLGLATLSFMVDGDNETKNCDKVNNSEQKITIFETSTETRPSSRTFRKIIPAFVCYLLSCFFLFVGSIACSSHYPSRSQIIGTDRKLISYLPVATDGMAIVSKVIMAITTYYVKINRTFLFLFAVLKFGLLYMCPYFFQTFPLLVLHCCLAGLVAGKLHIQSARDHQCGSERNKNVTKTRPLVCMCFAISSLCSSPFTGFLFDKTNNYDITFAVLGSTIVIGSFFSFVTAILHMKQKERNK